MNVHIKLLSPAAFLSPKCTKYRLAAGLRSAPPDPLAGLKGPTSKGREGGWKKGEGKGRGRRGEGREGGGPMSLSPPPEMKSCLRPWSEDSVHYDELIVV